MSVLVIGGSGYIGSRLAQELVQQGITTTVWDIQPPSGPIVNKVTYVERSVLDVSSVDLKPFETVVLLAGVSSVGAAKADPALTIRSNLEGLVRVLNAVDKKLLIYASSGSVYDGCGGHPASEDAPLSQPRNVYDLTKQAGDEIAMLYGTRWLGLRFGTVNGVSPRMRTDLVINRMVLTALRFNAIEVSNPHVHRSILCINDLVRFIRQQAQKQPSELFSGVVNLASFSVTIGEIGTGVAEHLNASIRNLPASSTYDFSMSTTKASAMFGFEPVGNIKELIISLAAHYRSDSALGL